MASDWDALRASASEGLPAGKQRGIGLAIASHNSALLGTGANVRLFEDGTVVLNTGAVDIGQGAETVLSQMCADVLQLPIEKVVFASPDTDGSPFNWGTTGSRVTYMTGRAVDTATKEVRDQIIAHAAEMLECAEVDLELGWGGIVRVKGSPNSQVTFFEVAKRAHWRFGGPIIGNDSLVFDQDTVDPKRAVVKGVPFSRIGIYSFVATVVEAHIDEGTGQTDIQRAWIAVDVGKAMNPRLVEGQLEGGFVQGLGYALCEEMIWDQGRLANPNMMDYKVPGSMDIPYHINTIIVEEPEPTHPFGAKGAGEIALVPVAPAIASAIFHGAGVRLRKLPMLPEDILGAIKQGKQSHNKT